jgi:hypothetical protein
MVMEMLKTCMAGVCRGQKNRYLRKGELGSRNARSVARGEKRGDGKIEQGE